MKKLLILFLGPALCLLLTLSPYELLSAEADAVLGIAIWMILWWITEVVAIPVTALIPLTFFPLLGIMDMQQVTSHYGHPIVFLFFGGFVMALTLEKVKLHKRIALHIIRYTGNSPNRIILGFMIATAFLSMWISNTATTVVMLPIAYSVIQLLIDDADGFTKNDQNFSLSIMLGIAYAANVGGIATLIGTPPNIVFAGFMESEYNYSVSFIDWMLVGIPFAVIMLGMIYLTLTKIMYPNRLGNFEQSAALLQREIQQLGPMKKTEKYVLVLFITAVIAWISKNTINQLFPALHLSDTSISMVAAMSCFVVLYKKNPLLAWDDTTRLPWGIVILFGGGLALAKGLSNAGLIDVIGNLVSQWSSTSSLLIAALLISLVLFMTELMSNVALIAIFAPTVVGITLGLEMNTLQVLIPVTMASSCAFMLPMSTPPNAIVFASGHIKIPQMMRAGIVLNCIAILLLVLFYSYILPLVFELLPLTQV